jgi:hypothetical protein
MGDCSIGRRRTRDALSDEPAWDITAGPRRYSSPRDPGQRPAGAVAIRQRQRSARAVEVAAPRDRRRRALARHQARTPGEGYPGRAPPRRQLATATAGRGSDATAASTARSTEVPSPRSCRALRRSRLPSAPSASSPSSLAPGHVRPAVELVGAARRHHPQNSASSSWATSLCPKTSSEDRLLRQPFPFEAPPVQ